MLNVSTRLVNEIDQETENAFCSNQFGRRSTIFYLFLLQIFILRLSLSYSFSLALATEITRNHLNKSQTTNDTVCVCERSRRVNVI